MQNLMSIWQSLDLQRKILLLASTLGMFLLILIGARFLNTPNMALLYANLEAAEAGEVIASLEAQGVTAEIRGGNIYVPASARDRLRLSLAAQGLPADTGEGYELLERMTGFGTTSQMFDAAYWRAKEGELARTISASRDIRTARVHIARESGTSFHPKATTRASVTLTMQTGQLSAAQATALQFLVASAVPGLARSDVAVIDADTGHVVSGEERMPGMVNADSRAQALKLAVERLMVARLGPHRAVVEVSVETVTAEETLIERRLDPEQRVVLSTDTTESSQRTTGSPAGGVGVASNLPDGEGATVGSESSQNSETRERVNYDISQTEREVHRAPGAIKRLTVAVLVDGVRTVDEDGTEHWAPMSEADLAALKSLVEAAVGYTAERGDRVTLESMRFDHIPTPEGTAAPARRLIAELDLTRLLQTLLLGGLVLLLARLVLKPVLSTYIPAPALPSPQGDASTSSAFPELPEEAPDLPNSLPMARVAEIDIPIENDNGKIVIPDLPDLPPLPVFGDEKGAEDDPIEKLKALIEDRKEETIEILRGWMEEREEEA